MEERAGEHEWVGVSSYPAGISCASHAGLPKCTLQPLISNNQQYHSLSALCFAISVFKRHFPVSVNLAIDYAPSAPVAER